ncbi:hypothetical protein DL98DRAFT_593188 [Cadophora sp. DSE1049]|nr:hypothetical protein DL98DRAFT_593188 [Cadophora sp. DSE1049]
MHFVQLPLELLRMCLIKAVKARGLRLALRLRLVNKAMVGWHPEFNFSTTLDAFTAAAGRFLPGKRVSDFECTQAIFGDCYPWMEPLSNDTMTEYLTKAAGDGKNEMLVHLLDTATAGVTDSLGLHLAHPLHAACEKADEPTVLFLLQLGTPPTFRIHD